MERIPKDEAREERIYDEAIVDAYGPEEKAMSWYYYLADKILFPFKAKCEIEIGKSPLQVGEKVTVLEMAPEEECEHDMFVKIEWQDRSLSVALSQLSGIKIEEDAQEAIEDWHYWVRRGYEF